MFGIGAEDNDAIARANVRTIFKEPLGDNAGNGRTHFGGLFLTLLRDTRQEGVTVGGVPELQAVREYPRFGRLDRKGSQHGKQHRSAAGIVEGRERQRSISMLEGAVISVYEVLDKEPRDVDSSWDAKIRNAVEKIRSKGKFLVPVSR